VINVLNLLKV